jgi:hypothetical protein
VTGFAAFAHQPYLNNCSDQVIDLAQVQQIYARLFMHIDAATSLLLKQNLVDAEFVREQNHRIFTKLHTIQDAALMRSSSQVPMQEAELQFHEDVSNGPTSLGDDDYGSISRRSFPCISTKSPPLDESGYPSDRSTPYSTDSPHTPERDLDVAEPTVRHDLDHHAGSASDPLRLAHSGPHVYSVPSQGDVGDKETRDHEAFYSIHPPANYLNYRQATQPLAQGHQGLLPKISRLD